MSRRRLIVAVTTCGAAALATGAVIAIRAYRVSREHVTSPAAVAEVSDTMLGAEVGDFTLPDTKGEIRALDDYRAAAVVVVAFLGTECPLARLYAPRLTRLAEDLEPDEVEFLGVMSNVQDTKEEIVAFGSEHGITFPLLIDGDQRVADQFSAKRTPEVFVLDRKRRVAYRGRIDDQFGISEDGRNFQKLQPRRHDLAVAIEELLNRKKVSVPVTFASGCHIGRINERVAHSEVTWSHQISRLFQRRCQPCHRPGQIGPFPLLTYEDTIGWPEMIREVVEQRRMPPWHALPTHGRFANDLHLTAEETALIIDWVEQGAPPGDPAELPPPQEFPTESVINDPDEIVYMSETPYLVPADGIGDYKYFFVDPGFKKDRWVKAAWCHPDNEQVVHHINVYFKPPWQSWNDWLGGTVNLVAGFLPGQTAAPVDYEGMALYIPAGSELVFEMHYTPNGTAQRDRSFVGLDYADPGQIRRELLHVAAYNDQFVIPPHDPSYAVDAWHTFDEDVQLIYMCPHMHRRGDRFFYDAVFPDGRKERLLEIAGYDYNWQTIYYLAEPKDLPKGTKIHCRAHFDNSRDNPSNPDPNRSVRWSGYTEDEMMVGVMGVARRLSVNDDAHVGTIAAGRPVVDERDDSPGARHLDRATFLLARADFDGGLAQLNLAIDRDLQNGAYLSAATAWVVKSFVLTRHYAKWIFGYLLAINLVTLALVAYGRMSENGLSRHALRAALVVAACAGGTPAAILGRKYLPKEIAQRAFSVPLGRLMASQIFVLCVCLGVFVQQH